MRGSDDRPAPVDLCLEVLKRLAAAAVLEDLVLVGSWCTHFYKRYFGKKAQLSALRTRDMDFLIRRPPHFKATVRVADLLQDLGFLPDLHREGCVSLLLAASRQSCYTSNEISHMTFHYPTVVIREGKDCWAYVPELPGVYGMGKTPGQAKKDLIGALKLYIEDCRADGDPLPRSAAKIVEVDDIAVTA